MDHQPRNPLFARVIVNRLWHYHFGVGLVDTPNDFGFNGGRPSHGELLDWLASEIVAQRWSLKQMHRAIVLSATYRQALRDTEAAARRGQSLAMAQKPLRLEAEAMRDAMLAVAGELNPHGGAGFRDFKEVLRSGTYTYEPVDVSAAVQSTQRVSIVDARRPQRVAGRLRLSRSVDHHAQAGGHDDATASAGPVEQCLRAADGRQDGAGASCGTGEDVGRRRGATWSRPRINWHTQRATADELAAAPASSSGTGWNVLTRAIFNSNEFLYID